MVDHGIGVCVAFFPLRGRTLSEPGLGSWATRYSSHVRTIILEPSSTGLDELLERRRGTGLDRLDEVWNGVLHMVPAPSVAHADVAQQLAVILDAPARSAGLLPTMHEFNIGESEHNFRVPDGGLHRGRPGGAWVATAALVVEIISPGDESWEKLPFYADHGVDEILVVDPSERVVHWLKLVDSGYRPADRSGLIDLGAVDLTDHIDWPADTGR